MTVATRGGLSLPSSAWVGIYTYEAALTLLSEEHIVRDCGAYRHTPSEHVAGYNNQQLTGVTIEECAAACCASTSFSCTSFDYYVGQDKCDLSEFTGVLT